ncbi:MAG: hypothetical protein ACLSHJ_12540 [Oscillospiraceae bacterium]
MLVIGLGGFQGHQYVTATVAEDSTVKNISKEKLTCSVSTPLSSARSSTRTSSRTVHRRRLSMRPATKWTLKAKSIGTYADAA